METIKLTEKAQNQAFSLYRKRMKEEPDPHLEGLRISVVGGGCSGLSYSLSFESSKEQDEITEYKNGLKVFVDPKSKVLLEGCTLEFYDDLNKTGFEVINPNATATCGCGKSFCN